MNISLEKLRQYPEAIEKYKNREIQIFHGLLQVWFAGYVPCVIYKFLASKYKLEDAINYCKFYKDESKICFFFVDAFGDNSFSIRDFDGEDVYNCTTVTFDNVLRNNK